MSLSKKYNIPQDTVKKMVNDGWLSCSTPNYEEVYAMYKNSIQTGGKTKAEIIYEICEAKHLKERMVYYIISKFK